MTRIFVIDTNVILNNHLAPFTLKDAHVILPQIVINELDRKKDYIENKSAAYNARAFCNKIKKLIKEQDGCDFQINPNLQLTLLRTNVDQVNEDMETLGLDKTKADSVIVATAWRLQEDGEDVTVLTVDTNMWLTCASLGINTEDHEGQSPLVKESQGLYTGVRTITFEDSSIIDEFYSGPFYLTEEEHPGLFPNQILVLKAEGFRQSSAIAMFKAYDQPLKRLRDYKKLQFSGIKPLNKEQGFAFELLDNKEIMCVSLAGRAGTGKSMVALSYGIDGLNKGLFEKIIILKPIVPVGKDIGFLPGPQPLDAKILTPTGWTTMGSLEVGDYVIGRDGKKTKVKGIFPKGVKDVYKVITTDGTSTEACEDHLWLTKTFYDVKSGKDGSVKTTRQIMDTLKLNTGKIYKNKINHYLPRIEAVEFEQNETLPMPPYMLGCMLGDGSCASKNRSVHMTGLEHEIIDRFKIDAEKMNCSLVNGTGRNEMNYHIGSKDPLYNSKPAQKICMTNVETNEVKIYPSQGIAAKDTRLNASTIHARCKKGLTVDKIKYSFMPSDVRWTNPAKNALHNLGLLGLKSYTKFIPKQYLYSSIENRLWLLKGLMDTDGNCKVNGEAILTTTSLRLAEDVQHLVRSLGGRSTISERKRKGQETIIEGVKVIARRNHYSVGISLPEKYNPFYLTRKRERYSKKFIHHMGIKSIELVGQKEVQCILVENPEHLYVTDSFIVTHNTMEEKLMPWIESFKDSLDIIFTQDSKTKGKDDQVFSKDSRDYDYLVENGMLEFLPMTYMRGRSIQKSLIILDECQNLGHHEIKTLLTRVGEGSKVICLGDIDQIDAPWLNNQNNGLSYLVERGTETELIGHITLIKSLRSPLADWASSNL